MKFKFFFPFIVLLINVNCKKNKVLKSDENENKPGVSKSADLWVENSLTDIFTETKSADNLKAVQVDMVKNESENVQIGIRSLTQLNDVTIEIKPFKESNAPKIKAMPVRMVYNSKSSYGFTGEHSGIVSTHKRGNSPGYFPEYYVPTSNMGNIEADKSYSVVVEVTTTVLTASAKYSTTLMLSSKQGVIGEIPVTVNVHNAVLPDPKDSQFSYTNWITPFDWWTGAVSSYYDTWYAVKEIDQNFFSLMSSFASAMKKQRQNTIMVPLALLRANASFDTQGKLKLTFSDFDRYIQTFIENGSIKNLEGEHWYEMNWTNSNDPYNSPLVAKIIRKGATGKAEFARVPADSPEAISYFNELIPLLYGHLKAKGWDKMWIQHVQDEPMVTVQHIAISSMYKRILHEMPTVRTIDAGSKQKDWFADELSIFCPQLDYYEKAREGYDYIGKKPNQELWTYTCVNPQMDNFMTRIADYPLISTRVIGWYLWKQGITGYLHWAWNLYNQAKATPNQPFKDMYCEGASGDGWLVYPDKENHSVYEGPRSASVRDSFEDYEILALAAKKNPAQTQAICSEVVTSGTIFVREPNKLLDARLRLIKLASQ